MTRARRPAAGRRRRRGPPLRTWQRARAPLRRGGGPARAATGAGGVRAARRAAGSRRLPAGVRAPGRGPSRRSSADAADASRDLLSARPARPATRASPCCVEAFLRPTAPDGRLLLAGTGSRCRLPDDPRVVRLGRLTASEVSAQLASARAVVLPSLPALRPEGAPLALIEALVHGRPLVVSDDPGCREIARDRRAPAGRAGRARRRRARAGRAIGELLDHDRAGGAARRRRGRGGGSSTRRRPGWRGSRDAYDRTRSRVSHRRGADARPAGAPGRLPRGAARRAAARATSCWSSTPPSAVPVDRRAPGSTRPGALAGPQPRLAGGRADVVAFVDDDVQVAAGLARRARRRARRRRRGRAAGVAVPPAQQGIERPVAVTADVPASSCCRSTARCAGCQRQPGRPPLRRWRPSAASTSGSARAPGRAPARTSSCRTGCCGAGCAVRYGPARAGRTTTSGATGASCCGSTTATASGPARGPPGAAGRPGAPVLREALVGQRAATGRPATCGDGYQFGVADRPGPRGGHGRRGCSRGRRRAVKVALYHPWVYLRSGVERWMVELITRSRHDWTVYTHHYEPDATYPEVRRRCGVRELSREVSVRRSLGPLRARRRTLRGRSCPTTAAGAAGVVRGARRPGRLRSTVPVAAYCHTPLKILHDPAACATVRRSSRCPGGWRSATIGPAFDAVDRRAWRHYRPRAGQQHRDAGADPGGRAAAVRSRRGAEPGVHASWWTADRARTASRCCSTPAGSCGRRTSSSRSTTVAPARPPRPAGRRRHGRREEPRLPAALRARAAGLPVTFEIAPSDERLRELYATATALLFTAAQRGLRHGRARGDGGRHAGARGRRRRAAQHRRARRRRLAAAADTGGVRRAGARGPGRRRAALRPARRGRRAAAAGTPTSPGSTT